MSCASAPLSRRLAVVLAMLVALAAFGTFTPTRSLAQEGAKAADKQEEAPHQKSKLMWFLESSGWIGVILLILSMYFIATVGRLFVELRPHIVTPPEVTEECDALLEKRDFKGIYAVVREDDSAYSRIVSSGLAELSNGLADAREAMHHVGEVITVEMERKISMLAVLGTLGPMIGLLGTL
ncbi:MAG TPA: MotA/TolQ/ExbB proton channel family protein, partial [Pirellulales bacterium]